MLTNFWPVEVLSTHCTKQGATAFGPVELGQVWGGENLAMQPSDLGSVFVPHMS